MRKLYYEIRGGEYECVRAENTADGYDIEFNFAESVLGALELQGSIKEIDGRRCVFSREELEDGIFSPVLYVKKGVFHLEPFEILGGKLRQLPKNDSYVRKLSERLEKLQREVGSMKTILAELCEKINAKTIF